MISLLILVLLAGCGATAKASSIESQDYSDNHSLVLDLQVDYGYDGYGKYGDYMPIYATINNYGAPYTGWFQVIIPNLNNKSTLYQHEVTLGIGEVTKLELTIPLNGSRNQLHYQLVDNQDKTVVEKTVDINLLGDQTHTFVGIFSRHSTGLEYLESEQVKSFYLKKDNLPHDYRALNPLDIILIDDYDLANIGDSNWNTIEKWVREGGILIIGSVPTDSIPFYQKIQGMPRETNPVFTEYNLSLGKILMSNIDLRVTTDNKQHSLSTRIKMQEKLLKSSVYQTEGNELLNRITRSLPESKRVDFGIYSTPYHNYRVLDTLKISDIDDIPSTWRYVLILLAYVFIVGPILYLILKKKDARSLTWCMVPALAIIFTIVIFILGNDTRKTQTTGSYIAYRTMGEDGNYIEETYFRLISPENDGYKINNLDVESIGIIGNQYSYASTGDITEYDYSSYSTGVTLGEDTSDITVKAAATFEPTYYTFTKHAISKGGYQYNITDRIDKITGKFTNELGYDLEDGVLFCNQVLIPIGDVQYQETITLDELPQINLANIDILYDTNRFGEVLFNQPKGTQLKDPQTLRRYYAIQGYIEETILNYNEKNYIIGFPDSDSLSNNGLLSATDIEVSGITAVVLPIQVDLNTEEGEVIIPNILPYLDTTDNYELAGYRYMAHETVDIRYQFYLEEEIRSIAYSKRGNNEFTPSPIGFYGEVYFYNNRTKEYDLTYQSGVEGVKTGLDDYIDENNSILIRYKVDRLDIEKGIAMLPNLTATKGGY